MNPDRKFLIAYFQSPMHLLLNTYRENMRYDQHLSGKISIKIDERAIAVIFILEMSVSYEVFHPVTLSSLLKHAMRNNMTITVRPKFTIAVDLMNLVSLILPHRI